MTPYRDEYKTHCYLNTYTRRCTKKRVQQQVLRDGLIRCGQEEVGTHEENALIHTWYEVVEYQVTRRGKCVTTYVANDAMTDSITETGIHRRHGVSGDPLACVGSFYSVTVPSCGPIIVQVPPRCLGRSN